MTKLNFMEKHLEEMSNKDLKAMIKDVIESTGEKIKGYHDFKKEELVETVRDLYADFIENEDVVEVEEIVKNEEIVENEEVVEVPKKKVERKGKFDYIVKNPDGEVVETFDKLKDVFNYAETNGICTRGWVSLSMERDIPVLMGLGRDKEIPEDFVPRVTKKYNGNYWKFEKVEEGEEKNETQEEHGAEK